jgi:hypothetical protein
MDCYILRKLGYEPVGGYRDIELVRDCCGNYFEVTIDGKFTQVPAPKAIWGQEELTDNDANRERIV